MTNIFDFLRKCLQDGKETKITPSDLIFIKGYLEAPDIELHFKAKKIDETTDNQDVMRTDFQYKGEPVELFELICEAGMQNGNFAELITVAARFFTDHVPSCPHCKGNHGANCSSFKIEIVQL